MLINVLDIIIETNNISYISKPYMNKFLSHYIVTFRIHFNNAQMYVDIDFGSNEFFQKQYTSEQIYKSKDLQNQLLTESYRIRNLICTAVSSKITPILKIKVSEIAEYKI